MAREYVRQDWQDQEDANPRRYLIDGVAAEVEKDGSGITVVGSPVNATRSDYIENGIHDNSIAAIDNEEIKMAFLNDRTLEITRPSFNFRNNAFVKVQVPEVAAGTVIQVQINSDASLNLQDVEGADILELAAGYYTFIAKAGTPNFFEQAPSSGASVNANEFDIEVAPNQIIEPGDFIARINQQVSKLFDFTAGFEDSTIFESGDAEYVNVVKIDKIRALVTYRAQNNIGRLTAVVATINDNYVISYGSKYTIAANFDFTLNHDSVLMDDDLVLIASCTTDSSQNVAILVSVVGNVVTELDGINCYTGGPDSDSLAKVDKLTTSKAVVTFMDGAAEQFKLRALVVEITSGVTLSIGALVVVKSTPISSSGRIGLVALSETKALVAYSDDNNNSYSTMNVLTITGNSVSNVGAEVVVWASDTRFTELTKLPGGKVIFTRQGDFLGDDGYVSLLTITGDSIVNHFDTEFTANNNLAIWHRTIVLGEDQVVVVSNDGSTTVVLYFLKFNLALDILEKIQSIDTLITYRNNTSGACNIGQNGIFIAFEVPNTNSNSHTFELLRSINGLAKGAGVGGETITIYTL